MKLLSLLAILLLFGAAFALTNIIACGVVNSPGAYDVNLNLTGVNDASCLNVTASDVSITCLGALGLSYQTIIGTNATNQYGVYTSTGVNDVNVSNCNIQNYTYDEYVNGGNNDYLQNDTYNSSYVSGAALYLPNGNLTVINNSIFNTTNQSDIGILSDGTVGANNITVANSTIWTNGTTAYGIYLHTNSVNWTIFNNTVNTTARDIYLSQSSVTNNNISTNTLNAGDIAYELFNAVSNIFSNNQLACTATTNGCVFINTLSANNITSNTISANTEAINFVNGNLLNVVNNTLTITAATGYGIISTSANNITVANNSITTSASTDYGIYLQTNSVNWSIINNTLNATAGTGDVGIKFGDATSNNTLIRNNSINVSGNLATPPAQGISIALSSNIAIDNNTIYVNSSSITGSTLSDINSTGNNTTIVNNTLIASGGNTASTADHPSNIIMTQNNNTVIANNTMINKVRESGVGAEFTNIYLSATYNVSITNNSLLFQNSTANTGTASSIELVNSNTNNTVIAGNTINASLNKNGNGIDNTGSNNIIANNTILVNSPITSIGILFNDALNGSATNNTINASSYGIEFFSTPMNNTASNNTINTSGSVGIIVSSGGNNSISSNNIYGYTSDGFQQTGGVNTGIINNTFSSAAVGLYFQSTANNTIDNNTIITTGNNEYGIQIGSSEVNDTFYNNTINTSGTSSHGFYGQAQTTLSNISLNLINVSGGGAVGIYLASSASLAENTTVFNNTIFTNTTNGTAVLASSKVGNDTIYANNMSGQIWVNDSNGTNFYNVSSIGNIYYLTSGAGVWTTGNGLSLTIASPPGWSTSGYGVNTTNFAAYWPNLGSDFFAWTGNTASVSSGLFCPVLQSNYGALIWQTVVAGNVILHWTTSGGGAYWGVYTHGSGAYVLNYTSPYGSAVLVPE